MSKKAVKLLNTFRITIPAGSASPAPPLGPALGQKGVNLGKFCKEFNERTSNVIDGAPSPTDIDVYSDRSFKFTVGLPISSWLLKRAAGIEKGGGKPGHEIIGRVNIKQIYEIAKIKQNTNVHLKLMPLESVCELVIKQAWGMCLEIHNDPAGSEVAEADSSSLS